MESNPRADPRIRSNIGDSANLGPLPWYTPYGGLTRLFSFISRGFSRRGKGVFLHPLEVVAEGEQSRSPAFERNIPATGSEACEHSSWSGSREPARETYQRSHSNFSHELSQEPPEAGDSRRRNRTLAGDFLSVERSRNRGERNFAGSREPNPALELLREEVKQECEELRDFLRRTAPKRSFPFVVRTLDRVIEEPSILDFYLLPPVSPEAGLDTPEPSEKFPPGHDPEPVQVVHLAEELDPTRRNSESEEPSEGVEGERR
jgi:hypothetical protein